MGERFSGVGHGYYDPFRDGMDMDSRSSLNSTGCFLASVGHHGALDSTIGSASGSAGALSIKISFYNGRWVGVVGSYASARFFITSDTDPSGDSSGFRSWRPRHRATLGRQGLPWAGSPGGHAGGGEAKE
mmetsp:Transcript_15539/g.31514  ORF Transcript_15539/g.31514 Transcript_15539/m.31514 type:complete len:130 (-) Transcript_15539:284-673(-)